MGLKENKTENKYTFTSTFDPFQSHIMWTDTDRQTNSCPEKSCDVKENQQALNKESKERLFSPQKKMCGI